MNDDNEHDSLLSQYTTKYNIHREKFLSRDPLCFANGLKDCQLSFLDSNIKELLNLCFIFSMEFNLLEQYILNGNRVITLVFSQGNISFSIPVQHRSISSSDDSFIDLVESSFYKDSQKEQDLLHKQLNRLTKKDNSKLKIFNSEWVLHQRDELFVYQKDFYNSVDSVFEKIIQTHFKETITLKDLFESIQSLDEELQFTICNLIYKLTHNTNHLAVNAERFIGDTIGDLAKRRNKHIRNDDVNDASEYLATLNPLLYFHQKTIQTINKEYETKERHMEIYNQIKSRVTLIILIKQNKTEKKI